MAASLDLQVPRNGSIEKELQLLDVEGAPIDLTGHTITATARETAGTGSTIATAAITLVEPTDGRLSIRWNGSSFDAVGEPTEIARVAWDMKHVYPSTFIDIPVRGQLIIFPEVTA